MFLKFGLLSLWSVFSFFPHLSHATDVEDANWFLSVWPEQSTADSPGTDSCASPSDVIRYHLEATRKGSSITDPIFNDSRSSGETTSYISSSIPPTTGGGNNDSIGWTRAGVMNPGDSFEVTYDVGVKCGNTSGTRIKNFASAQEGQPDNISAGASVSTGKPNVTKGGSPHSEDAPPDPVQAGTGELYTDPETDITLGGPLPLFFSRRYGSRFKDEKTVQSSFGDNWMHNFDLRLGNVEFSFKDVVLHGGKAITFVREDLADGGWSASTKEEIVYQFRNDAESATEDFWLMDPVNNLVYRFDGDSASAAFKRLVSIHDRNGNTLTLTYDGSGKLTQVSDGIGRTLTFTYTGTNLTGVSDGTRNLTYGYASGNLTSFTDALGNITTYEYDAANTSHGTLLTGVKLPLGNKRFTQTYNSEGQVTQQTDAFNNSSTLQFDTHGQGQTQVTDPDGTQVVTHQKQKIATQIQDRDNKTMNFSYDDSNRPDSVQDRLTGADQGTTTFTYHDKTGFVASVINAKGDSLTFTYTAQDQNFTNPDHPTRQVSFTFYNRTRIDLPDGANEQFTYDANGNQTATVDRTGKTWNYTYNGKGQLLTGTNPTGGVTTFTYNADGTLDSGKDADTGTTTYSYDAMKRLIKVTRPDGAFIEMTYDQNDRVASTTDENNHKYTYTYDANGNRTQETDPSGETTAFAYDAMDRIKQLTDRLSKNTAFTYDSMGRIASITDPNSIASSFGYDKRGWFNQTTIGGQTWQTGHDDEGVTFSTTTPLSNTTAYQTDKLGFTTGITNPMSQATTLTRDSMNRATGITDPLSRTTNFGYDDRGLLSDVSMPVIGASAYARNNLGILSQITDLNGQNWTFGYTDMGRPSSITDPLSNVSAFSYDTRGRLNTINFPDSTTDAITYDSAGNVTQSQYTGGLDLQYTYDALNRLLTANNISFTRDAEGRITSTDNPGTAFGAAYDDGGRLKTATYNNGLFTVTYAYDATTGILSSVTDDLTNTQTDFTYDNDRRLTGITRPNGVNTTYAYDNAARLTRIQDGSIIDLQYTLDAAGQVSSANMTMPLDPASLLAGGTETFTYDDASQVSTAGYNYDQRGRLTASPGNTHTWDGASRLTGISSITLSYNGVGELVTRDSTHYYYNYALGINPIVAEKNDSTGQFLRYYVWTPGGRLLYMIDAADGNKVYHFHFDRTGNTLVLTDNAGTVTDSYAYTPYGKLLGHNGASQQPFTFVGQWGVRQEGTSGALYHMRARYYDATTARFLSRDPVWPIIASPQEINPYQYAINNPMLYVDPRGTEKEVVFGDVDGDGESDLVMSFGNSDTGTELFEKAVMGIGMGTYEMDDDIVLHLSVSDDGIKEEWITRKESRRRYKEAAEEAARKEEDEARKAADRGLFYMERVAGQRESVSKVVNKTASELQQKKPNPPKPWGLINIGKLAQELDMAINFMEKDSAPVTTTMDDAEKHLREFLKGSPEEVINERVDNLRLDYFNKKDRAP